MQTTGCGSLSSDNQSQFAPVQFSSHVDPNGLRDDHGRPLGTIPSRHYPAPADTENPAYVSPEELQSEQWEQHQHQQYHQQPYAQEQPQGMSYSQHNMQQTPGAYPGQAPASAQPQYKPARPSYPMHVSNLPASGGHADFHTTN